MRQGDMGQTERHQTDASCCDVGSNKKQLNAYLSCVILLVDFRAYVVRPGRVQQHHHWHEYSDCLCKCRRHQQPPVADHRRCIPARLSVRTPLPGLSTALCHDSTHGTVRCVLSRHRVVCDSDTYVNSALHPSRVA